MTDSLPRDAMLQHLYFSVLKRDMISPILKKVQCFLLGNIWSTFQVGATLLR